MTVVSNNLSEGIFSMQKTSTKIYLETRCQKSSRYYKETSIEQRSISYYPRTLLQKFKAVFRIVNIETDTGSILVP